MSSASNGKFLVKESVNFPGDYVLFVWYVTGLVNLMITRKP